jgi:hypothetical protein
VFLRVLSSPCNAGGAGVLTVLKQVSSSNIDLPYAASTSSASSTSALGLGVPHASLSTPALHNTLGSHGSMRMGSNNLGMGNGEGVFKSAYHADPLSNNTMDAAASVFLGTRHTYDGYGADVGSSVGASGAGETSYPTYTLHSNADSSSTLGEASASVAPSQSTDFLRQWSSSQPSARTSTGSSGYYMDDGAAGLNTLSSLSMSNYVTTSTSRIPSSTSIDAYPMFPALASLSSSLPDSIPKSEKSLPPLPSATRMQCSDYSINSIKDYGGMKSSAYPRSSAFNINDTTVSSQSARSLNLYSGYTDSSGGSSGSNSRTSSSTHRSPAVGYVPSSPSVQIPSSQRSTPTLMSSSSASAGSVGSYVTPHSSSSSVVSYMTPATSASPLGYGSNIYPSGQTSLLGSSIDPLSTSYSSKPRTDLSELGSQSTPRGSNTPAPILRTSSSSTSSTYPQNSEQRRSIGISKVY